VAKRGLGTRPTPLPRRRRARPRRRLVFRVLPIEDGVADAIER
jgi:hypothetical protein